MLVFSRIGNIAKNFIILPIFKIATEAFAALCLLCAGAVQKANIEYWLRDTDRAVCRCHRGTARSAPVPSSCPSPACPRPCCSGDTASAITTALCASAVHAHAPPCVIYYLQHARVYVSLGVVQRNGLEIQEVSF